MNGKSKIELMLELKNKIKGGLNQAKKDTFRDVNEMQMKMNSLKFNFTKNSKAIADEVPLIGQAFKMATNPIALTAAGLLAIGKGMDYTTQKAADFNTQFRGLANLNLDKSKREVDSLKRMVLDSSFNKGFDTEKTIMGYFDVQSTTGKFGGEVKKIVEQQGEFANLMQADFNNYIAGTAKGMANFGFGVDKLEEFNRSAYATMKVGVITFDQLAKVQSVYSGAAAANNQTFDTANKLMALFTIRTKSVDEAATLTKSMFNDLTKKSTIDAFKKVGLSLYESNGQIKQADKLLFELNKKFSGLDKDSRVVALKNQFSGSEGLIALIQAATDKSGQLQSTLNGFDSTKLGLNKALELAKNDVNYINEQLKNKIDVMTIKLGEEMLPIKQWWLETRLSLLEYINYEMRGTEGKTTYDRQRGATSVNEKYADAINNVSSLTKYEMDKIISEIRSERKEILDMVTKTYFPNPADKDFQLGKATQLKSYETQFALSWQKKPQNGSVIKPKPLETITPQSGTTTLSDTVDTVTGSARQVRNLTVNIDSFNKGGINTANTNLQHMDGSQMEEWFTEMCMRVVRSLETAY